MKKSISFPIDNFTEFRIQMLNWANRFNIFCFLDNRQYDLWSPAFECLLAAGSKTHLEAMAGTAFDDLHRFHQQHPGEWMFGHFGYDLKNETMNMHSANFDGLGFSDLYFFIPETVVKLSAASVNIYSDTDAVQVFNEILSSPKTISETVRPKVTMQHRIPRAEYISIINELRRHILRGDCYEINFCQEFYAEEATIDPLFIYHQLTSISPNPFSVMYKNDDLFCLCASPERYLKRSGQRVISQPIKGTSKRDLKSAVGDEVQKQYLLQSSKEKSENIMVVDLVRNDLSRICRPGTVQVDELFGLYSFPQVHQMISTISGELKEDAGWLDAIKATFPMGSMTGAPKKRVMELVEKYEKTRRGLFSGAIGYFSPAREGEAPDFDFNVVIRSIFYNARKKYLSFQTGGGITYHSEAEKEYEECLLKAAAIKTVLE